MAVAPIFNDGIFPTWYEHPVTRTARARFGGETPRPLELFEVMYELLTELDEKFPGIPMRYILNPGVANREGNLIEGRKPTTYNRDELRLALIATGVDETKAEAATRGPGRPRNPVLDRALAEAIGAGMTQEAVAAKFRVSRHRIRRAVRRVVQDARDANR